MLVDGLGCYQMDQAAEVYTAAQTKCEDQCAQLATFHNAANISEVTRIWNTLGRKLLS